MGREGDNRRMARDVDRKFALAVARYAHQGQKDKGGKPYVEHPIYVMQLLEDPTEDERKAALLHDVVEDTFITIENLRQLGFSDDVVEMVRLVTRPPERPPKGLSYVEWIRSIKESGNGGAIKVKIADLRHNLSEKRLNKLPKDIRGGLRKRYEKALSILIVE